MTGDETVLRLRADLARLRAERRERLAQAQAEAASQRARADHYSNAYMAQEAKHADALADRDEQLARARALAGDVLAQVWAHDGPPPEMAGALHRLWKFSQGGRL